MTLATADTEEGRGPDDANLEAGAEKIGTESIVSGQGEEAEDDDATEAAMLAGWNRTNDSGKPDADDTDTEDADKKLAAKDGEDGQGTANANDDPDVAGLGMKASEVRAKFGELETLKKSAASTAGHLGHLKNLVTQAGKGKTLTKDDLKNVSKEFGDEYAEALANDLNAAGFGGGSVMDPEAIATAVSEQVEKVERSLEKKAVLRVHRDADSYFAGGANNAKFMTFVGTLPTERQQELASSWDSDVINRALDEFKTQEKKAVDQQAKQQRRVERAVGPTKSTSAPVVQPTEDPLEVGWRNVMGRGSKPSGRGARA